MRKIDLSAIDEEFKISMIDITGKAEVTRVASAIGSIKLKEQTLEAIEERRVEKGDVFTAAKLAAINAVKKTSELILLAHPIPITSVTVSLKMDKKNSIVRLMTEVKSKGKTGVEIEALMGVMTGLLTIFDMCKYLEKDESGQYDTAKFSDISVVKKSKG